MTTDAAAPATKRPADASPDVPPSKLPKTESGEETAPAPQPHAQQPPPARPSTSTPNSTPNLAALLVPVPPRWTDADLRAWLTSAGVTRIRVARKKKGANLAFLSFGSAADRVAAGAAVAAAPPPPGMKKHSRPTVKDDNRRVIVPASQLDVRDVVAPLWRVPYSQQLAMKWVKVRTALARLGSDSGSNAIAWPPAALTPVGILRSPATRGYRNKCEFSVGPGVEDGGGGDDAGNKPPPAAAVGFCLGAFKDGIVEVGSPGPAPHVSPTATAAADAMTGFLATGGGGAGLPAWDKAASAGFWRLLTVREARADTPMPRPAAGSGPEALLEEGLADTASPCPAFANLNWESWLVPAGVLPPAAGPAGPAAPAAAAPPPPPPPPPPPLPPPEEVMLVVQVDPTAAPPETAASELAALSKILVAAVARVAAAAATPTPPTVSVWVQHHSGPSNAASEDAPLTCLSAGRQGGGSADDAGGGCLTDTLAGLRFRVSPASFFQVNTPAAALLYRAAVAWADPAPGDVVLDVCCGTGTLGVCAARVVAAGKGGDAPSSSSTRVLGVDITPSAIADAAANATANGLDTSTCTFVAGRAEEVLAGLLEEAKGGGGAASNLIAIVDPPRAGLHPKVAGALRGCAGIKRIVYVSCNVESQVADARRLCAPGGVGAPFRPVKSLAVDLFPHTAHVESVLLLER